MNNFAATDPGLISISRIEVRILSLSRSIAASGKLGPPRISLNNSTDSSNSFLYERLRIVTPERSKSKLPPSCVPMEANSSEIWFSSLVSVPLSKVPSTILATPCFATGSNTEPAGKSTEISTIGNTSV